MGSKTRHSLRVFWMKSPCQLVKWFTWAIKLIERSLSFPFFSLQVRSRHCLQIGPQAWVDRQELCLLGAVPLQQFLGGAAQLQRTGHRALATLASRWCPAGLRRWLYHILRCRRLTAPAHLPRLLCAARLPCLQRVEQVSDHTYWAAHPRPPWGPRCWELNASISPSERVLKNILVFEYILKLHWLFVF